MDGIAWASSAMVAARTRLDIATVNLANVSTDGFHKNVAKGVLTNAGVEISQNQSRQSGALRHTGNPLDLAIVGPGAFHLRNENGTLETTRDGRFVRNRFGNLCDERGREVIGTAGPVHVPEGATIDERGRVLVSGTPVGRIPLPVGSALRSGFIECADVDAIGEMVTVLAAQRSFESAEKVVAAIDGTRQKSVNDVARVKE